MSELEYLASDLMVILECSECAFKQFKLSAKKLGRLRRIHLIARCGNCGTQKPIREIIAEHQKKEADLLIQTGYELIEKGRKLNERANS